MIKRETLMAHRRVINKMDYTPTRDTIRMLCDGALELLDALEGGPDVQQQRAELKERERQIALALDDLHAWAREAYTATYADGNLNTVDTVAKVRVGIEKVKEMLRAKGPRWKNEWSWWRPQIDEEFDDATTA
jgi:hypothetical protein